MKKDKKLATLSRGLKYKLRLTLYLMAILPILVSVYLASNYILPKVGLKLDIVLSLAISTFIAGIGFFIVKGVFDRILSLSWDAKMIAAGDITHPIEATPEDEVGDLGSALNQLTQRIRTHMDELKNYSERTTEINLEIQKRILVLSSLLQVSSLISQSAKLEDILKITVEKSRFLANSELSYLLFKEDKGDAFEIRFADGLQAKQALNAKIEFGEELFAKLIKSNRPLIFDQENKLPPGAQEFFVEKLNLANSLALPIFLGGNLVAFLGVGSLKDTLTYKKDDVDLLDIFAKQVAIAIENDQMQHRIEKLEIKDALTGLYNDSFIRGRLQEEIKRAIAYQRPCAYLLLNVDGLGDFQKRFGSLLTESALKKIGTLIRESVTEIDRVGRVGDGEFAIVLPEKNKRHALTIAEGVRRKIEYSFREETDELKRLTVSGGVSENPLDGVQAEELIARARELLKSSEQQGKNHIAI